MTKTESEIQANIFFRDIVNDSDNERSIWADLKDHVTKQLETRDMPMIVVAEVPHYIQIED